MTIQIVRAHSEYTVTVTALDNPEVSVPAEETASTLAEAQEIQAGWFNEFTE